MKTIFIILIALFSVTGYSRAQADSVIAYSTIEDEDTTDEHPDLEEFYSITSFTNLMYFTKCYAQMKHGETKLYDHLVVKGYHKATSNLIVNAEVNKLLNKYRKNIGLSSTSIESILSERIIDNHKASILHVLNELDRKPLVMQLVVEYAKCDCPNSIFENLFDYPDIVDVIRDPRTTYIDIAFYQVRKGSKRLSSYTVITYDVKDYEHPFYMTIENEPEIK